jgi:hypothetical protein
MTGNLDARRYKSPELTTQNNFMIGRMAHNGWINAENAWHI